MNLLKRVLVIYLLLASQLLCALEVEGLFEAEVVAERGQDKSIAIRQALKVVLTRILAGDNVFQDITVKTVLANAEYYVNEFQYSLAPVGNTKGKNARLMRVQFNEHLLVDIIRPSKIGLWNEVRPNTLIWLIVEKNGVQNFFDAETMPDIDLAFNKAAIIKGVPVLFPIYDLQEKQNLSTSDVLSAYSEYLLKVSQRYDVVSTLAGKLAYKGGCWKADWTLYFDDHIRQWSSQCRNLQNVASSGLEGVYSMLSKYYSVKPELKSVDSVILKISHVENDLQLAKVNRYIEALSMVKTVTWIGINAEYNLFRVFYQGSRKSFNDRFKKDQVLRMKDLTLSNADEVKYQFFSK